MYHAITNRQAFRSRRLRSFHCHHYLYRLPGVAAMLLSSVTSSSASLLSDCEVQSFQARGTYRYDYRQDGGHAEAARVETSSHDKLNNMIA